jgi:hypothetical protein
VRVLISNRASFSVQAFQVYLGALQVDPHCQIRFNALQSWNLASHGSNRLLQLADCIASATLDALNPDAYGNTEPRYLGSLWPLFYRRGGNLLSYGFKLFPTQIMQAARACYPWLG